MNDLYDVLAVNLKTKAIRIFGRGKTERNAEAIIDMSIARRGLDVEFYTTAPAGKYNDGDTYEGPEEAKGEKTVEGGDARAS